MTQDPKNKKLFEGYQIANTRQNNGKNPPSQQQKNSLPVKKIQTQNGSNPPKGGGNAK